MTGDCHNCRDYRGCPGKMRTCPDCRGEATDGGKSCATCNGTGYINEGYLYNEIRWCPQQVIWILQFKETLMEGRWPQDPYGADNNTGSRTIKTEASFVKPGLVIAELEERLKRCGTQAELLVTQVEDGRTLNNLSPGAREVLMYVKGKDRKNMGFKKWLRRVYYRPKSTQKGQLVGAS